MCALHPAQLVTVSKKTREILTTLGPEPQPLERERDREREREGAAAVDGDDPEAAEEELRKAEELKRQSEREEKKSKRKAMKAKDRPFDICIKLLLLGDSGALLCVCDW
jgi:hypothetical protein